ncbi:MAG: hypothetical protein KYQ20_01955 [Candidatus Nealsonbacteria bacterium]|nr:hypothetical protein [Candidatus Nealsonbacteria bacterium]
MFNQDELKKIKKTIEEFFKKTGFEVKIESLTEDSRIIFVKTTSEDPKILIGERGQVLLGIQHLLRALLRKKIINRDEPEQASFFVDLDINDYKKKKIEYLKELAENTAEQVILSQKTKTLFPMSAYERRIIHLALAERTEVFTESIGEDFERRVVVGLRSVE